MVYEEEELTPEEQLTRQQEIAERTNPSIPVLDLNTGRTYETEDITGAPTKDTVALETYRMGADATPEERERLRGHRDSLKVDIPQSDIDSQAGQTTEELEGPTAAAAREAERLRLEKEQANRGILEIGQNFVDESYKLDEAAEQATAEMRGEHMANAPWAYNSGATMLDSDQIKERPTSRLGDGEDDLSPQYTGGRDVQRELSQWFEKNEGASKEEYAAEKKRLMDLATEEKREVDRKDLKYRVRPGLDEELTEAFSGLFFGKEDMGPVNEPRDTSQSTQDGETISGDPYQDTLDFTDDLLEGKLDGQIEEQEKAKAAAAKAAREQGKFGTKRGSAERDAEYRERTEGRAAANDAEYRERTEARARGELPEQVAKQQEIQERLNNRRDGYQQRRDARAQADADRRAGRTSRGSQTDAARSTNFPSGVSTSRGMNVAMTTASINGQTRSILSSDPNRTLRTSEWNQTFADNDTAGIEAFDNTAEVIGTLDTPKARQWNEQYQQIQTEMDSVNNNQALTPAERQQAMADLNSRRARLATSIPSLGDLGAQSERQEMEGERKLEAENLRESKQKLTDFTAIVKAADERKASQEEEGIPVSEEQYYVFLQDEYSRRQRAAQIAQDLIDGKMGSEKSDASTDEPMVYSDANGGLIPYTDNGITKFRNATTPGMEIPSKRIGNTVYPAPRNDAQVKSLPTGSAYYDPKTGALNVSKLGPKSPRQRYEESRAEFEADQIKLAKETSNRVHYQMDEAYKKGMTKVEAGVLMMEAKGYSITPEQLMRGELPKMKYVDTDMFSTNDMAGFMSVPANPNTDEGRKQIQEQVRHTLDREEIARKAAMQHAVERESTLAPYVNASANYETVVSGNEVLVRGVNGSEFEAYIINQKNSEFVGTAIPIFDDTTDLRRAGYGALNTAYYNPTAGRVIAPNFPRDQYSGTMTEANFDSLFNAMMKAYPGLLTTEDDQRQMFNYLAEHSGYDRP